MADSPKRKVIVFDADDTLWMNDWQYSGAYAGFFTYLYHVFEDKTPNLFYVYERFCKIDSELFEKYSVRRGRVAEAMILTYREIGEWVKWRFGFESKPAEQSDQEEIIRQIGDFPFDYEELKWLPEARVILEILRVTGHRICFLSSYDVSVFQKRARFLGLDKLFSPENMKAVERRKTKEDFIAVSGWSPENDASATWYAVGNGESDIKPALDISENWRGIYVPHGTTSKYLSHEQKINKLLPPLCYYMPPTFEHPRVTTIYSLSELPRVLEEI